MDRDTADGEIQELLARIRQVAYDLHVYLGTGLLEKVYENGLSHRLKQAGFKVETQRPLKVYDIDGFCLGVHCSYQGQVHNHLRDRRFHRSQ